MLNDRNKNYIERYTPPVSFFIVTITTGIVCYNINWYITASDFSTLLNISLALSAIYLGFTGTAIGELISISGSFLMDKLYEYNRDEILIKYVKHSAYSSVTLFLLCTISAFYPAKGLEGIPILLFSIWLGIFISTFCYAYRVIYYLFVILNIVNKQGRYDFKRKKNHITIAPEKISGTPVRPNPFIDED